jgi:hypothetical protein
MLPLAYSANQDLLLEEVFDHISQDGSLNDFYFLMYHSFTKQFFFYSLSQPNWFGVLLIIVSAPPAAPLLLLQSGTT